MMMTTMMRAMMMTIMMTMMMTMMTMMTIMPLLMMMAMMTMMMTDAMLHRQRLHRHRLNCCGQVWRNVQTQLRQSSVGCPPVRFFKPLDPVCWKGRPLKASERLCRGLCRGHWLQPGRLMTIMSLLQWSCLVVSNPWTVIKVHVQALFLLILGGD